MQGLWVAALLGPLAQNPSKSLPRSPQCGIDFKGVALVEERVKDIETPRAAPGCTEPMKTSAQGSSVLRLDGKTESLSGRPTGLTRPEHLLHAPRH